MNGWIYFAECPGFIKVGHSKNPLRREHAIRAQGALSSSVVSTQRHTRLIGAFRGSRQDEMRWHHMLMPFLAAGREWYTDCAAMRRIIDSLPLVDRNGFWACHQPLRGMGSTVSLGLMRDIVKAAKQSRVAE